MATCREADGEKRRGQARMTSEVTVTATGYEWSLPGSACRAENVQAGKGLCALVQPLSL